MKYVTFTHKLGAHEEIFVVLFNEESISHAHMAFGTRHAARGSLADVGGAVFMGGTATPRSAGFFGLDADNRVRVYGRSESLNLGPMGGDDLLIAEQIGGVK